jgi:hypothetical protein
MKTSYLIFKRVSPTRHAIFCFEAVDNVGNIWREKFDELAGQLFDHDITIFGYHDGYGDIAYQQWSNGQFDEGIISEHSKEYYYGDKMLGFSYLDRTDFDIKLS